MEKSLLNGSEFSCEYFLQKQLTVYQPKTGYRFSIDSFLLAGFVQPKPNDLVLELGAGCGIILLLLALKYRRTKFVGLEIQERLAKCLQANINANALGSRVLCVRGDLRKPPFPSGLFDFVLSNPPFYRIGSGRLPPNKEERLARHEILTNLEELIRTASFLLKTKGRFGVIYPASRLNELFLILERYKLRPKRLRMVYSYPGDEGRLVLLEAIKGGKKELRVCPALFIYESPGGAYTSEVEQLFAP